MDYHGCLFLCPYCGRGTEVRKVITLRGHWWPTDHICGHCGTHITLGVNPLRFEPPPPARQDLGEQATYGVQFFKQIFGKARPN